MYQAPPSIAARRASRGRSASVSTTSPTAAAIVDAVVMAASGRRIAASVALTPVTKPFWAYARSYRPTHCMAATAASSRPPSRARCSRAPGPRTSAPRTATSP